MNKLTSLLREFYPNGVPFYKLKDLCNFERGSVINPKFKGKGSIPVIAGGVTTPYCYNKANREGDNIVIAGSGNAGYVSYWTIPIYVSDAFTVDVKQPDVLLKKYVFYFLKNIQNKIYQMKEGSTVPHIYPKNISNFEIPVPPIAVQSEIVRILDNFTELIAELTARKKQYEYYRNKLLTFK